MREYVLNIPDFREDYQPFTDAVKYTDRNLLRKFKLAQGFISEGCTLRGDEYYDCLTLLTAHLLWNEKMMLAGQTTVGILTGATISKVSVTMTPPPAKTSWQFWLSTSPYGLELWAKLSMLSAGGYYIGGMPERKAFRKVGGTFR